MLSFASIGVGPVRGAVTAADDFYGITFPFVLEDQAFSAAAPGVLGNDSAGAGETPCLVAVPTTTTQGGTLSLSGTGAFTYTPPADFAGSDSFSYGLAAAIGDLCPPIAQDTAVVTFTVTQVNDAPALALVGDCADGVSVDEDSGAYLGGSACVALDPGPTNEAGQELAEVVTQTSGDIAFVSGPTITTEGFLQFRPAPNDFGSATVTITGRDNGGTANGGEDLSAPVELTITVASVPDAPLAAPDAFSALRDRTLNIAAPGVLGNDSDADGNLLNAVLASAPVHGVLTLAANGSFSYTPASGYVGPDAFSYRATDGGLSSATRIVSLTVTAVPVATPTPAVSMAASAAPTLEPSAEVSAEPTLEASPSLEPGETLGASPMAPSAPPGPGSTPEPEPAAGSRGLSLPLLLVAVLFGVLLVFAGVYYIPRWINARQGERPYPE